MSTAALLDSVRTVTAALLSWAEQCGLAPSGALAIGGAAKRTEIEGGGPAVVRVGDVACRLYLYTPAMLPPVLYVSTSPKAPFVWVAMLGSSILPPDPTEPGTPVPISGPGSPRVTCG